MNEFRIKEEKGKFIVEIAYYTKRQEILKRWCIRVFPDWISVDKNGNKVFNEMFHKIKRYKTLEKARKKIAKFIRVEPIYHDAEKFDNF
jgi:hypothetical protein